MTLLTALEIAGNYPENILIEAAEKEGKFAGLMHMTREGEVHKLMVSTAPAYDSTEAACAALHGLARTCKEQYSDHNIFQ